MTTEDNYRPFHETDERVTGVGKSDAVADAGAVKLLAFLEGLEEALAGLGLVGEFGDELDEFVEDLITVAAPEVQSDGRGSHEAADAVAVVVLGGHVDVGRE
jgi:hypothetical protein